ncbi:MAG: flippase [bacterium]
MNSNIKKFLFENSGIRQTIFKNTFWLALTGIFSKGITFLVFIWLARYFGPEIYGKWNFALSFVSLFVILVDFGFSALVVREIARDKLKSSEYIDNILIMKLVLGLAVMVIIIFLTRFLEKDIMVAKLVYFLAFYVVINNFTTFFQSIFRAYEKMQYETLCQVIQNISLLGLSIFFIFNNGSILTISYVFAWTSLLGLFLSVIFVHRYFSKIFLIINLKICREILEKAWPFLFAGIFYMIYFKIGSVMLGMLSDMKEVGYYNAAYNLFIAAFIFPEIITMSFFPKLSYFYDKDKLFLKKIFFNFRRAMTYVGFFLTVILFLSAGFVINNLYSLQYYNSIILLRILSLIIVFKFLSYAYSWFLTSVDEQKQILKIQGLAAILNIIFNYFLIIKYNSLGAVVATVITELFLLFFYYLSFRKKWEKIYKYELTN